MRFFLTITQERNLHFRFLPLMLCMALAAGMLCGCGSASAESDAVAPEVSGDMTVVFPKLGSADAAIFMTEEATVVIDTGESNDGDEVLEILNQYGKDTVDLLVITHYDKDHVGGAAEVLEGVTVKRVIGSTYPKDSDESTAYYAALSSAGLEEEILSEPLTLTLGGMVITIDPPGSVYTTDESNNASNIISVTYGKTSMLITGDAMSQRWAEYVKTHQDTYGTYDLIKIPHHGRDIDLMDAYLPYFRQSGDTIGIVTSSNKEPEDTALLNELRAAGHNILRTLDGDITVVSDGNTLTVSQT